MAIQLVNNLTTGRNTLGAVVNGGYIYAIGGAGNSVERAAINSDGSLGQWQTTTSMTIARSSLATIAAGHFVYALGGNVADNSVERASINYLSLTGFSPSIVRADQTTAVTINGTSFLPSPSIKLGDATNLSTSYVSTYTLNSTIPAGLASGWYTATLTNLDGRVATLTNAVRVDSTSPTGNLTINNGALSSTSTGVTLGLSATDPDDNASVLSMSFSNDGTTWGTWQQYATSVSWTLASGDGLKTVYVRFKDAAGNVSPVVSSTITLDTAAGAQYGVTINDGALFTNQISVALTIGALAGTPRMMVSNDGGFANAQWEPYSSRKAWTITQYGSYVIPRVVYVRYGDVNGTVLNTSQDDIILDVNPPTGSVSITPGVTVSAPAVPIAKPKPQPTVSTRKSNAETKLYLPMVMNQCSVPTGNPNVTLHLSATDDVSGVGSMLISNRADFYCATWVNYATASAWYMPPGVTTVYVKFRDNAGNVSTVVTGLSPK